MRGFWHIIALSTAAAAISVIIDKNILLFVYVWLTYLYFDQRIKILPVSLAILSTFFFYHHIPSLEAESDPHLENKVQQIFAGKIADAPIISPNKVEFILEEMHSDKRYIVIHFPNEQFLQHDFIEQIKYGAKCELEGILEVPPEARNPGQFDYQHFLLTKNITHQIIIDDFNNIDCEGSSFLQRFFTLRSMVTGQLSNKVSDYTASWLNALVVGDRSRIDEATINLFQKWSLTHLLAISGLHVGIITGFLYYGLIKLNILTREKAEVILLLFLPTYAVLAGGQPSVLRAVLMMVILLLTSRLKIKLDTLDVISIAFITLLLLDQYIVYHIGFQFSFIVTFGIILSRKWLASVSSPAFKILIISFVSQMIILPLQLNYFSIFQPLSIVLNLIIVPYFSIFVIPFMFLFLLALFLPESIFTVFDQIFIVIHQMVLSFIDWVDRLFSYPLYFSDLPSWIFVFYYLFLISAHYFLDKNKLKQSFTAFLLLIFLVFGYASKPYFSAKGTVTMLDIGQGDAFIIELPYRKGTFMIDAGARFSFEDMQPTNSVYKQIIQPYLRHKGIHQLDAIFLTHEDIDHVGSLEFIIEDGATDKIYVSSYFSEDYFLDIEAEGISIKYLHAGDIVDVHGHPLFVMGPIKDKGSPNENSLVLFTEIGGLRWLFTGDITKEEERELLESYNIKADILKVAHHGSSTSTDQIFIESISPAVALVPVGENNRYGHPTEEVLNTLENNGIEVYRSDVHGAVQYVFREGNGVFKPFVKE